MKIRKKRPKPSGGGLPFYVVGYSPPAPSLTELQLWFDLEYGGPLKVTGSEPTLLTHGPWTAWAKIPLPEAAAEDWAMQLDWRHQAAALILRPAVTPQQACDTILHSARLARGLGLLTQGTAYDLGTHTFLNPSDWQDRPLDRFCPSHHILTMQSESPDPMTSWFHTLGLSKFGLDELETFRPTGLPAQPVLDTLHEIAGELLRIGRSPSVGTTLSLPLQGLIVSVIRHRTAAPAGRSMPFREITWPSK